MITTLLQIVLYLLWPADLKQVFIFLLFTFFSKSKKIRNFTKKKCKTNLRFTVSYE